MSPRRRGGPAREGALPVKGRLAPPAPAAAGPFPEPLKQRDGRGAALPTAPRAGGGRGLRSVVVPAVGQGHEVLRGCAAPRALRKRTSRGQRARVRPGRPDLRSSPERPPCPP